MYCEEMHKMFKKIPVTLPEPDNHKKKLQLMLEDTGRESYTNKLQ